MLPLAGCAGDFDGGEDASAGDTPVRGGSVTIVDLADISKPMPLISESSLDNAVNGVLYMSILAPRWEDGELHYLTADRDATALAKSPQKPVANRETRRKCASLASARTKRR